MNDNKEHRISALIPVHNAEQYIGHCVRQVQENLGEHDEAIFVVNGTTDSTTKILSTFARSDKRLRIINLKEANLVKALNIGVTEASNSWIARFDVDDDYMTSRLNIQRKLLNSEIAAVFSDYTFFGRRREYLGYMPSGLGNVPTLISLFGKNRTPHPAAVFSREIFLECGSYKQEEFPAEDLGLWLRMSRFGKFASAPRPLLNYRLHSNSISMQQRSNSALLANRLLEDIGLEYKTVETALNFVDEILATYNGVTFDKERRLLFLLNLGSAIDRQSLSWSSKSLKSLTALSRIFNPVYAPAIGKLGIEYLHRWNYRREVLPK